MTEHRNVAVIGLGIMGSAFADNLVAAGHTVKVWNRTHAVAEAIAGATATNTVAEAVADADVVILMLPTAQITIDTLDSAALAALPQGAVVAQMGTIGAAGTEQLAQHLAERPDLALIDAPVSGTKGPAIAGTLTILASGTVSDAQRAALDDVFDVIGGRAVWLGDEPGAGSRMKLVVNAWLLAMMQGIAEASILGERLGITPAELWAALDGGPLASPYIKGKLAKLEAKDYDTEMGLAWGAKDARLALQAFGKDSPMHLPDLTAIAALWTGAADMLRPDGTPYGDADISAIREYLLANRASA